MTKKARAARFALLALAAVAGCKSSSTPPSGEMDLGTEDLTSAVDLPSTADLASVDLLPPPGENQLVLHAPMPLDTATCAPLSVSVQGAGGAVAVAQDTTVTVNSLGAGQLFTSLVGCRANSGGQATTATVTISAGQSATAFYYHTDVAQPVTLQASAGGLLPGSLALDVVLFSALGQGDGASNSALANGQTAPGVVVVVGTRLYVADAGNNRVLVWKTLPTTAAQPPDFALGQPAGPDNLLANGSNIDGATSAATMNGPEGIASDGTRLFVADSYNHRVLVWSTLPTTGGQPADFALGQPVGAANLTSNTANSGGVSGSSLSHPFGVFVLGTLLYVGDSGNNRVLVWSTLPTAGGQAANFALGQPAGAANLTSGVANNGGVSGTSMSVPSAITSDGTRLFVVDRGNSRVLVWSALPTAGGRTADFALGQPSGAANLTSNATNNGGVSGSSLYIPFGVSCDGTHLYVSDEDNNRVLVWSTLPTVGGQSASFALGQPSGAANLTSNSTAATGAATLDYPSTPFSDGTHLFVTDGANHRTLVYSTLPTTGGQAASFALGQPAGAANLTSGLANNAGVSASLLRLPAGIATDGTHLFVVNRGNNRVLVWSQLPTSNGQPPDFALGQPAGAANLLSNIANNGGVSGSSLSNPWGVASDGTRLMVADTGNHRILVWSTIPTTGGQPADFALGQPAGAANLTTSTGGISASQVDTPYAVATDGVHVFVADTLNSRVLLWNTLPTAGGQAADLALGQPAGAANLTSNVANNGGISGSSMYEPGGLASDGVRLYVADSGNNRVLVWNSLQLTGGQPADFALGQPAGAANLTSSAINNGGISGSSMYAPYGVATDGARLYVADDVNYRVLVWNALPTTGGQSADRAQGQISLTVANLPGSLSDSLSQPLGVATDGTRLFVTDSSNDRVVLAPVY